MNNQNQKPATQQNSNVKKFTESTVENILNRIASIQATGELVLPENYVAENAVRAAWLILQEVKDKSGRLALDVCTSDSISFSFIDMVTKGLSVAKNQGYFVVYGNELKFEPSYIGKITVARRDANVKEVNAVTVYKDDVFEYEVNADTGRKKVIKHQQSLTNIDMAKIAGAYAIVTYNDGSTDTEIMTIGQIHTSWGMGGSKGNSPAHRNFPDQMAEKTVISRALKIDIGSSDDSSLTSQRSHDTTRSEVNHEIKEKANSKEITFEEAEVIEETSNKSETKEKEQQEQTNIEGPGF